MSGFKDLGLGGKLESLNQKIVKLEQEVAGMRGDVRQILAILKEQRAEKKTPVDTSSD